MSGKTKVKGLIVEFMVYDAEKKGNPLHFTGTINPVAGKMEIDHVCKDLRLYILRMLDSFLDRLNEEWNSVMSPPPVAALIVSQILGGIPQELKYLLDPKDPVTQLLNEMNERWLALGQLRKGESGDMLADNYMESTVKEIEKVRPTDPIIPLMYKWVAESKKHVATQDKPQYIN